MGEIDTEEGGQNRGYLSAQSDLEVSSEKPAYFCLCLPMKLLTWAEKTPYSVKKHKEFIGIIF
jgi:hypothetical protein